MKSYQDLIGQTFDFPTQEFRLENNELLFNNVPLRELIAQYGTPLKLTYLPKISQNIQKAKSLFNKAIEAQNYGAEYLYAYCTKASHFRFVLDEVLKNNVHLETSSGYDIAIVRNLHQRGKISKETLVICNGYKMPRYTEGITDLLNEGFENCIPVLDNLEELAVYNKAVTVPFQVGIRVAADEEPNFGFYTSRLGVRYGDVMRYYTEQIEPDSQVTLKMLHFFINTGIKDTSYYWSELSRFMAKYCELRKVCPTLDTIDIGGGFPIKYNVHFEYDYEYMINEIVRTIKWYCEKNDVPVPHIVTEFGSYTVGESGATLYGVAGTKLQNDKELWYMIDGSFITQLPDIWGVNQKYIMLAINHWDQPYHKVKLGGLTCDSMDYYNSEAHAYELFMPQKATPEAPLYLGFFHTGAYQESIGGYGGLQHCLIPAARHVIIDHSEDGSLNTTLFADEQSQETMLQVLGY